jgi:hypothetical protein
VDIRIIRSPVRAPPDAIVERSIGTLRWECLDYFTIIEFRHLRQVLHELAGHDNTYLPHWSLDQHPSTGRVGVVGMGPSVSSAEWSIKV